MFYFITKAVTVIILILIILATLRTIQEDYSKDQTLFLAGTAPSPAPEGFYNGSIGRKVSWLGKKFDTSKSEGINVFSNGATTSEGHPFITMAGKGLRDKNKDVLKIEYNIPENPLWVHPILDEIVQVAPNEYLGKLHLRIIPGFPFTLGFFTLKK